MSTTRQPGAPRESLSVLAQAAGLQEYWTDAHGQAQRVDPDTLRAVLTAMGLPCGSAAAVRASHQALQAPGQAAHETMVVGRAGQALRLPLSAEGEGWLTPEEDQDLPGSRPLRVSVRDRRLRAPSRPGRYRLHLPNTPPMRLAIAPAPHTKAAPPLAADGARLWGIVAQIYSLRTDHPDAVQATWGHGDLHAVRRLARHIGAQGADVLALSPLHALFWNDPGSCSPYSPSSRLFRNTLYAAPADVLGADAARAAMADLPVSERQALDAAPQIDWPRAAALRKQWLRRLHTRFCRQGSAGLRAQYQSYLDDHGQPLLDHATFESLHEHRQGQGHAPRHGLDSSPWNDPRSGAISSYRAQYAQDIDFHCFLQWLTDASLSAAQKEARDAGMQIGLLSDLAVGASPHGSQAWSQPDHFLTGVSIGAPPDLHNPRGQVWGLTAFSPLALQRQHYQPFVDLLHAALAHVGGARIDHILGFQRLWIVPEGAEASQGAYLRMPANELFALAALEAWRHKALLIGENLGTVPEGFNGLLSEHGILGMDVLWFMRQSLPGGAAPFIAPARWSTQAVSMTSTHDLPTLSGWWHGRDLVQRKAAGLIASDQALEALTAARREDRSRLWHDMGHTSEAPVDTPLDRLLGFSAGAACPLFLAPLEDLAGLSESPNVPGTIDECPNWRQRLPFDAALACQTSGWQSRLEAIRQARNTRPQAAP